MAAGQKKVIVRFLTGGLLSGYLPNAQFVDGEEVLLIDSAGRVIPLLINDIKHIAYVKDFNLSDEVDPERIGRRTFLTRPRGEGIWVRISYRDGDILEGLAASNVGFVDTVLEDKGVFVTPPEVRGNAQRIYVPRSAIATLEFVAVITTAARRKSLDKPLAEPQRTLFEDQ